MKITQAYLEEQKRLHASPRGYGTRGRKWVDAVLQITAASSIETVLDYGAGQGTLGEELRKQGFDVVDYDPAVERFSDRPMGPFDLVTCTDVLEHVEEACLDEVLDDLAFFGEHVFVVVSTVPTEKTLSDGRQAHITLHPREWWIDRFAAAGLAVVQEVDVKKPGKEFALVLEHRKP